MRIVTLCLLLALAGCAKQQEAQPQEDKDASGEQSTVGEVVDGFTGRTHVKAYKQAKEKIKRINAQRQEDFEDFQ